MTTLVDMPCTLQRGAGSPIPAATIELRETGMRLTTRRPLAVDETVSFDLPVHDAHICGRARVICQERPDVYALRFDRLSQPMAQCLHEVICELAARDSTRDAHERRPALGEPGAARTTCLGCQPGEG